MSRNLAFANLDDDIPMISNNNTRQVILNPSNRERGDRTWRNVSRGRNSPMPNRNFKGGQAGSRRPPPLRESNWYRVTVSIFLVSNYILYSSILYNDVK